MHDLIDELDEDSLRVAYKKLVEQSEKKIVAFSVKGEPLNQKDLERRARKSLQQIEDGEYISAEDLEKKWQSPE